LAAVESGLFGGQVSLVPLAQASWDGDTLTVPFDKQVLKAAAPRLRRRDQHGGRGRVLPPLRHAR
jgi:hypothetical protein